MVESGRRVDNSSDDLSENDGDREKLLQSVFDVLPSALGRAAGVRRSVSVGPVRGFGGWLPEVRHPLSPHLSEDGRF